MRDRARRLFRQPEPRVLRVNRPFRSFAARRPSEGLEKGPLRLVHPRPVRSSLRGREIVSRPRDGDEDVSRGLVLRTVPVPGRPLLGLFASGTGGRSFL